MNNDTLAATPTSLIPSPLATPDTERFWAAMKTGQLLLRRCTACGEVHYYPRPNCPFCSAATEWVQAAGTGTVHSYSVMQRADPPYIIAFVMLEEGVAMMTNIVDCAPGQVTIGMPVGVVFRESANGTFVPMFSPREAG